MVSTGGRTGGLVGRLLLGAAATVALGAQVAPPAAAVAQPAAAKRPNIVVILVDDMGFSDISSFGSEIPTPNIDALAAGGLRFTQFYNAARCSCSRASLLTGLYPHEAGLGHLEETVIPGSKGTFGRLADRAVTLGEVLHSAGYYTAMAGKWHVGVTHGVGPWNRGFDRSLTLPLGGVYFKDQTTPNQQTAYIDGRKLPISSPEVGKDYWYASDLWVDWDTKFFHEAEAQKKPFFLYLPFTAPHFSLMAPPEDIAKFKGRYLSGWEPLRRARFERQKQLGIVGPDETLPPMLPEQFDWAKLDAKQRDRFDTMMAIYAATVSRMDKAVGTLIARLKAASELDNTLILFLSDNGGNAESGPNGRTLDLGGPLGSAKSSVFTGMNWATLQNTPFQFYKHYTEEGGISTPLIAYWPKGIDPKLKGSFVREPGHLIDIMPTLAQVAGATYPTTYNSHAILPMEGRSMVPAFSGQTLTRGNPIFWMHEDNRAVRDGQWKLVAQWHQPWRLYDMARDRSETRDVAAANPAIVQRMGAQYTAWAARSFVDPWPRKDSGGITEGPDKQKVESTGLLQQPMRKGGG